MSKFCEIKKVHAWEVVNLEYKEILPPTIEDLENYNSENVCYVCYEEFKGVEATCLEITSEMKKCFRLKGMLKFMLPFWNLQKITIVFHNRQI